MKKLILKTIAITLASILALCLLTFGVFALFFPAPTARFFDNIGGYSASVFFYEKQYNKTGDIEDLSNLVVKVDDENDSVRAESFLADLVYHQDFDKFCQEQDLDNTTGVSTKEYYMGSYASVLVKNGKFEDALTVADDYVKENGYTSFNPFSVIIMENGKSLTTENLTTLKLKILGYSLTGVQLENVLADLQSIQNLENKT